MALTIYLNANALDPTLGVVNPDLSPAAMPDMTLGNTVLANVVLLGAQPAGLTLAVNIGFPGQAPMFTNNNFTATVNGWSGLISVNTAAIAAAFVSATTNPLLLEIDFTATNNSGNAYTYAAAHLRVWNRVNVSALSIFAPMTNSIEGTFPLTQGADSGQVSGLALPLAPRSVLAVVRKPAGGFNIFPTIVSGTITTDGFQFTLSAQPDAATYNLDFVLLF